MQLFKKRVKKKKPKTKAKAKTKPQPVEEEETPETPKVDPLAKPITFEVVERVSAKLSQDGELSSMEVLGESFIKVNDP